MSPRPIAAFRLALALVLQATAAAEDGGPLFTTYCSACHGTDGRGATGGQFPPLAGSPWLRGEPDRAIKAVLHGLHGPIEVDGSTYNLEMPPQGAVLSDAQLAAILTHVRSSWGNREAAVKSDTIARIRRETPREKPWTAEELLQLHPLPKPESALKNLISRTYHGSWGDLPDFSTLQAVNVEEEHDGLVSVRDADRDDLFGLVWEGEFEASKDGAHTFFLDCDDAGRVVIDGKTVVEVRGHGPMGQRAKRGRVKLEAGRHPVRIEYLEFRGGQDLVLAWKGPGDKQWRQLSETRVDVRGDGGRPSIPIAPKDGRAVVYRNFIQGTTPRAIGFGFPGGVNLAYSADHLAPELLWTGDFIDAGRHWTNRGQGAEPPAGEQVVTLGGSPALPEGARFRGYQLDAAGNPTFTVGLAARSLLDAWQPASVDGQPALQRRLTLEGDGPPVEMLVSDRGEARLVDDQDYILGDELGLRVEGAALTARDGRTWLSLAPGQPVTLTYHWK